MKVAVGLSGGVDSSVAAAILQERGYEVIALCMKIWGGASAAAACHNACYGPDEAADIEVARSVARHLAIPFHVVDLVSEYKAVVLDYFRGEYISGRTPNPCIRCNQRIKFSYLLAKAREAGINFDSFATGHYARVEYCSEKRRFLLKKGRDVRKDQSYWLAFLGQHQLAAALFPLGDYTKGEVREKARILGLSTHDKPDSQDFFSGDYKDLINLPSRPGPIIDRAGSVLGSHNGIWSYTIGQRKGLGISAPQPLYVIDLDVENNAVVVGHAQELAHGGLIARNLNLISTDALEEPREVEAKIRYAHKACPGILTQVDGETVALRFKQPLAAITPGQAVVFYDRDSVVGGAIIERALD